MATGPCNTIIFREVFSIGVYRENVSENGNTIFYRTIIIIPLGRNRKCHFWTNNNMLSGSYIILQKSIRDKSAWHSH